MTFMIDDGQLKDYDSKRKTVEKTVERFSRF